MAGRKIVPLALKIAKGTNQKCRTRKGRNQSPAGMTPPPWLPAAALNDFEMIKNELGNLGLDSSTFGTIAALAASRIADIRALQILVEQEGRVVSTAAGGRKSHPAVSQLNEARRHLQSLLAELGLTATASNRLSRAEPTAPAGFDKL